jgi:hypothetical protein
VAVTRVDGDCFVTCVEPEARAMSDRESDVVVASSSRDDPSDRRNEDPSACCRRSAAMRAPGCSVLAVRHQFGVVVAWVLGIFGVAVMLVAIRGGLG